MSIKPNPYSQFLAFMTFTVDNKKIEARFSFVFLKVDHNWKIISHHSSLIPKKK